MIATILARWINGERHEDLRAASGGINLRPSHLAERAGHDADDLMTFTVQGDGLPDNRGVAAEAPPPQRFPDHRHACRPGPLVFGAKAAAGEGRQAEHAEHRRGDRAAGQALRLTMVGEGDSGARERRERFRARRPFCPREIVERRDAEHRSVRLRVVFEQLNEPVRCWIRQWAQHDGVDDTEDGRAAAHPQRDREQGRGRHDRRTRKQTERVTNVLPQHGELLPGRSTNDIGEKREPEAEGAFVPGAIAVEICHLRPVLLPELTRIQPQQTSIEAGTESLASHNPIAYARFDVKPTARACRSNTVSRSASAWAMSRPDRVIR